MKRGFSLVELSIVLVILGLLVGGVLSGQSLIRAAELRGVASDLERTTAAIHTFRDKYFALPGDMTNATAFWSIRNGSGNDLTCHQTINNFTGTCNGNGNGQIEQIAGDATLGERFLAWQHLANAGLIEGRFTGASNSTSSYVGLAGTNVPRGKLANTIVLIGYIVGPLAGQTNHFDGPYSINFIGFSSGGGGPPLKPEEAWNIDTKLDDGKPGTGRAWTWKNTSVWGPGCADSDLPATAQYALNNPQKLCELYFSIL